MKKDSRIKLLQKKVKEVRDIIEADSSSEEDVYGAVIDFVLILEYILKNILYKKNKLLIYNLRMDEIDKVGSIIKGKKHRLFTIQLSEALLRYIEIFPKSKLTKHAASLQILIKNRNQIEHGIDVKDMQSKQDLLGVLSTIFPIFIVEAEKILGVLPTSKINKDKTYSEKVIQSIYDNIVLSKVQNYNNDDPFSIHRIASIPMDMNLNNASVFDHKFNIFSTGNEQCPRCRIYSLSKKYPESSIFSPPLLYKGDSELYVCSKCNLELTKLEYDAVQRLKKQGKINSNSFL